MERARHLQHVAASHVAKIGRTRRVLGHHQSVEVLPAQVQVQIVLSVSLRFKKYIYNRPCFLWLNGPDFALGFEVIDHLRDEGLAAEATAPATGAEDGAGLVQRLVDVSRLVQRTVQRHFGSVLGENRQPFLPSSSPNKINVREKKLNAVRPSFEVRGVYGNHLSISIVWRDNQFYNQTNDTVSRLLDGVNGADLNSLFSPLELKFAPGQ